VKVLIILMGAVLSVWLFHFLLRLILNRIFRFPQIRNSMPVSSWGVVHRPLRITTLHHKSLQAVLCAPDNTGPLVIGIHGYENTAEKLVPIAKYLAVRGYRILLVNTRNHGDSDPDGYPTMIQFIQDLQATIRFSRAQIKESEKFYILGHSLGAAVCLYVAGREPGVCGVIAIASFADLEWQMRQALLYYHLPVWIASPLFRYLETIHRVRIKEMSPQRSITRISVPLLLLHGDQDRIVPPADFQRLCSLARHPQVRGSLLSGDDHSSLLNREDTFKFIYDFLRNADEHRSPS
jgi:uncharacterized protein